MSLLGTSFANSTQLRSSRKAPLACPRLGSFWPADGLLFGPKVFFWTIGYHPERPQNGMRSIISQAPYLAAYAGADGCILYGEDGRRFLRKVFPRKPLFVAQNTIDVDEIRLLRDTALPYPRRGWPELVSIGRMTKEKNFTLLLRGLFAFEAAFAECASNNRRGWTRALCSRDVCRGGAWAFHSPPRPKLR